MAIVLEVALADSDVGKFDLVIGAFGRGGSEEKELIYIPSISTSADSFASTRNRYGRNDDSNGWTLARKSIDFAILRVFCAPLVENLIGHQTIRTRSDPAGSSGTWAAQYLSGHSRSDGDTNDTTRGAPTSSIGCDLEGADNCIGWKRAMQQKTINSTSRGIFQLKSTQ